MNVMCIETMCYELFYIKLPAKSYELKFKTASYWKKAS